MGEKMSDKKVVYRTREYRGWELHALDYFVPDGIVRVLLALPPADFNEGKPVLLRMNVGANPDPTSALNIRIMTKSTSLEPLDMQWVVPSMELMMAFHDGEGDLGMLFDLVSFPKEKDGEPTVGEDGVGLPDDLADALRDLLGGGEDE